MGCHGSTPISTTANLAVVTAVEIYAMGKSYDIVIDGVIGLSECWRNFDELTRYERAFGGALAGKPHAHVDQHSATLG